MSDRRFFSAADAPIEKLIFKKPMTDVRSLALNKPNMGGVLWASGEIQDGLMKTEWTQYLADDSPELAKKKNYKWMVEVQFKKETILWLETPNDYFTLDAKYFTRESDMDFGRRPDLSKLSDINPRLAEKMRKMGGYKFALDWSAISDDYAGVYVSGDVVSELRFMDDYPLGDFYGWDVETLAIWSDEAITDIINHPIDPNNKSMKAKWVAVRNWTG